MDTEYIVSKMNRYLHEAAQKLAEWLHQRLPQVTDTWWEDCVIANLSFQQREIALSRGFNKLSDFDLAALLRIANKSWYDLKNISYLPAQEREVIRQMIGVRNNWAHCGAELPGKDTIIRDIKTIEALFSQLGGGSVCRDLEQFMTQVEEPDSVSTEPESTSELMVRQTTSEADTITENAQVYLVATPEIKGIVLSVRDQGGLKEYRVFADNRIQIFYTGQIALVAESNQLNWVSAEMARCLLTAYQIRYPSSENLYSLNAARIDFVPYQFRPALKLLHADEPRILIADSVGVGKTIEAGLIIKELEARGELNRILIICPKPLVAERKWELEMKRFDEEFVSVDGPALRSILSDTQRDGEWPARYNRVIIPFSILDSRAFEGDGSRRSRCYGLKELDPEPHFDLVIVDEAHHIRNGSMEKQKAFAYKCTKYFCDHADAVVMLTATPLQTGDNDLFTLLNVLRPDVMIDPRTFEMMARPNEYIYRSVRALRSADSNWRDTARQELVNVRKTQWGDNVIAESPLYREVLSRLENNDLSREERVRLISDVESLHSFNSFLNRTRRRDIQDFCVRRTYTISTQFTAEQRALYEELLTFERIALSQIHDPRAVPFMMSTIKRQAASCLFGLAPCIHTILERRLGQISDEGEMEECADGLNEGEMNLLARLAQNVLSRSEELPAHDSKYEETLRIIQEKQKQENNKIMLFSSFRHTLAYLKRRLSEEGLRVEQVDGSVKDEQRYAFKERFELPRDNPDAIDLLLFTEVGSEGLDYQFCNTIINYDLPWNPMRIEQRIGRIDRRGQRSESVSIYNIVTEDTVDADIYYRCLMRIGIFEHSIGECEEILGEVSSGIEALMMDAALTEEERREKLEQMADNEIRRLQEMNRLEEEEKELFGFDTTEFTTTQEIKRAENPWLSQYFLQKLVEGYLKERLGEGRYLLGDGALKTLRLARGARGELRKDFNSIPGKRNAVRRQWDHYLKGHKPNHTLTFDGETAAAHRDSFFISPVHPLAKQAAAFWEEQDEVCLALRSTSEAIPAGTYPFVIYAWRYTGFRSFTRLVPVCENEIIAAQLPELMEESASDESCAVREDAWAGLEKKQAMLWKDAREEHRREVEATLLYRVESLTDLHNSFLRSKRQQIRDSENENVRRMWESELRDKSQVYEQRIHAIQETGNRADVFSTKLMNGILTVEER